MKKSVKIGDILTISRGASPRPISKYITTNPDGINWIKIGDVEPNSFYITKTEEKITSEGATKSRLVKEGDFILSNSMSFGRPYILKINGCVHDGWLILSDYEETLVSSYLYYLLRSPVVQSQFDGSANGSTVRNLNSDIVRNVKVSIHTDKKVQKEISNRLDTIQSAIDNKKQQLSLLDEAVKSEFVEMFGEPHDNKTFPYKLVGEFTTVTSGGTPDRKKNEYWKNGTIPWVKTTELQNNEITEIEEFITQKGLDESSAKIVPAGTLLIAMYGQGKTRGMTGYLGIEASTNQACACILPSTQINQKFLWYYFILSYDKLRDLAKGGNQPNLNGNMIKSFPVLWPPLELQNEYVRFVQQIDKSKFVVKQQITDLQELLDSKMQEYFS